MTQPPCIELINVTKSFILESGSELKVLENINLSLYEGEMVAIVGPSGCGKSTLLRHIAGLIEPTSGYVLQHGKPLEGVNKEASLAFQSFALFPWQTVYQNIATALEPLSLDLAEVKERIDKAINWVSLGGFEEAYPRELSGGMKQRLGLARALAMRRPILLLDEPFSALDLLTADTLRSDIVDLFLSKQTDLRAFVLVTHNIQDAIFMASKIYIMGINPGHVQAVLENNLPYPRDVHSTAFKVMQKELHRLISEVLMPDSTQIATSAHGVQFSNHEGGLEMIPSAAVAEVLGLLETVQDQGGIADLFELASCRGKDFGHTLLQVKTAELLGLVDTPKHEVLLTQIGKKFVQADLCEKKRVIHSSFGSLRIVKAVRALLEESDDRRLSALEIEPHLHKWLAHENPKNVLKRLIAWGRYAQYFGYNDNTSELYLESSFES